LAKCRNFGVIEQSSELFNKKQPILEVDASFLPLAARTVAARARAAERQELRESAVFMK